MVECRSDRSKGAAHRSATVGSGRGCLDEYLCGVFQHNHKGSGVLLLHLDPLSGLLWPIRQPVQEPVIHNPGVADEHVPHRGDALEMLPFVLAE